MDPGRKVSMTRLIFAPSWWHGSSVMKRSWSKHWDLGFVTGSKKWSKKYREKKIQKCSKSISLDSGHLDKPFGPLIFHFFQIWFFFDRFFGLFFWFGDPLDPLTCISLREGVMLTKCWCLPYADAAVVAQSRVEACCQARLMHRALKMEPGFP